MDNIQQIAEIKKYQRFLQQKTGTPVDEEVAALLWIRDYAQEWRMNHSVRSEGARPRRK